MRMDSSVCNRLLAKGLSKHEQLLLSIHACSAAMTCLCDDVMLLQDVQQQ
jgi:hypothetical protein